MQLLDYLWDNGLSPRDVQAALGEKHFKVVMRWCRKERKPRKEIIEKIRIWTCGHVSEADWDDPTTPRCAIFITLPNGKRRMSTPFTECDGELDAAFEAMRSEDEEDEEPYSPPVMDAIRTLGLRVKVLPTDRFFLDDRPSDIRRVVVAANRIRIARGQMPIRYPGVEGGKLADWVIKSGID